MPLDEATFSKDLTNCIADSRPIRVRHKGREFNAWQVTADDAFRAVEGGIVDDMTTSVIVNQSELGKILPQSMDDMDLFLYDKWVRFQVQSAPDRFHGGISPIYQIYLQSPQKGIS